MRVFTALGQIAAILIACLVIGGGLGSILITVITMVGVAWSLQ